MAQLVQQVLKAQHLAELEQVARQNLEKTLVKLIQQYMELQRHGRNAKDRYNHLHKAWITGEALLRYAESQIHRERHACQVINLALKHEKELREQMSSHLEHIMESTKILYHWLYVQQIEILGKPDEEKERVKEFDSPTLFFAKESLAVKNEQLQLEIDRLREERAVD